MSQESSESFFTELLKFVLVAAVIVVPLRLFIAQPFIVSGASMEPTFDNGQYLIVDELSYHLGDPKRGDVVIFRYPKDPSQFFIKRVIGLPGERVTVENNRVLITSAGGTEAALEEPYVINKGNGGTQSVVLGSEEYFVMGDNRPESSDSRTWGGLPRRNIVGRALVRLLPVNQLGIFPGSTNPTI